MKCTLRLYTKYNYELWSDYYHIDELQNSLEFAAKLLTHWEVDWFIWWNISSTWDVLNALYKNVWIEDWVKRFSSYFIQEVEGRLFFTADCAVQPNPNAEQLAEIAFLTGLSVVTYWMIPKIAMLSYSTNWSAQWEDVTKIQEATKLLKEKLKEEKIMDWIIEWEIQFDAAIDDKISIIKNPDSILKGEANILIFPDLNSWNICYKALNMLKWSVAVWPILQWFQKPCNDLSRGSTVEEILNMYYITKYQASLNRRD